MESFITLSLPYQKLYYYLKNSFHLLRRIVFQEMNSLSLFQKIIGTSTFLPIVDDKIENLFIMKLLFDMSNYGLIQTIILVIEWFNLSPK